MIIIGRIVLCEASNPDGTNFDSTLGYSGDWIALHINDPSLQEARGAALVRRQQREVAEKANKRAEAERVEMERAKAKKEREREKNALASSSKDALSKPKSKAKAAPSPPPPAPPRLDGWKADSTLWKEGGTLFGWQKRGVEPPIGFVPPLNWNPNGWKKVDGAWINFAMKFEAQVQEKLQKAALLAAQKQENAVSSSTRDKERDRDASRTSKADERARIKAESERALLRAEGIARERAAWKKKMARLRESTGNVQVIPSGAPAWTGESTRTKPVEQGTLPTSDFCPILSIDIPDFCTSQTRISLLHLLCLRLRRSISPGLTRRPNRPR